MSETIKQHDYHEGSKQMFMVATLSMVFLLGGVLEHNVTFWSFCGSWISCGMSFAQSSRLEVIGVINIIVLMMSMLSVSIAWVYVYIDYRMGSESK